MNSSAQQLFHPLQPGKSIEGDWCNFPIPVNIEVGENTVFDSSFCFKKFFSTLPVGLKVGDHVTIQGTALAVDPQGYLEIGNYCYLSSACIAVSSKVHIGNHVFMAGGVTIVDTDFHPLDAAARIADTMAISTIGDKSKRPFFDSAPVSIEDDVWIGYNATILKGVVIGRGSVIEAGAVVSKSVPAGSLVSGNPAVVKTGAYA